MPALSQLYIVISSNWTPFASGLATPVVKVHHDEGVANRIEPEPCGFVREGRSEASAEGCIGQPSSRERHLFWTPTLLAERKAMRAGASPWRPSGRRGRSP